MPIATAHRSTLALVMLSAAITVARAQQPAGPATAGATRPHVEVLKDLPESQLFPVMNAIATSLNVTCEHCHVRTAPAANTVVGGWAFDREDKPAKQVARRMLKMTMDLNAASFNGRERVTCFTCHRGSLSPSRLEPLPPVQTAATSAGPALPGAAEVIAAYRAAVGVDAASRVSTTLLTATDDRSENRRGLFEVRLKGAGKFRVLLRMPGQPDVEQGMDETAGWLSTPTGVRIVSADELLTLKRAAARYAAIKIVDAPEFLRVRGVDTVRDRPAYVLEAVVDAKIVRRFAFDLDTHLLVRESTITETLVVPVQTQIDYEDYRSVDGVKLPFLIRTSDDAPYSTATRRFTNIVHNVPLDDALFKPPAGKARLSPPRRDSDRRLDAPPVICARRPGRVR
jgi:hypothetical protein